MSADASQSSAGPKDSQRRKDADNTPKKKKGKRSGEKRSRTRRALRGKTTVAHNATGIKKVKTILKISNSMGAQAYVAVGMVVEDATQRSIARAVELYGSTTVGKNPILTGSMMTSAILSMVPQYKHGDVCGAINDALDANRGAKVYV